MTHSLSAFENSSPRTWRIDPTSPILLFQNTVLPEQARTLDQVSACLPTGAYTTFRTYGGNRVLRLGDHFRRLEQSASLAGKIVSLDESTVRAALREAILQYRSEHPAPPDGLPDGACSDLRLRLTLSLETVKPDLYIAVEILPTSPQEAYLNGVEIITTGMQRLLPEAKLTRFIERSKLLRLSLPAHVNEAVMVDESGFLKEGLTSNFFGVLDGVIWTAGEGVLAGVTRGMLIEIIQREKIPLSLEPIQMNQLPALEEAIITSSSRGVMPVCRIDRQVVGSGEPGPVTRSLKQAYELAILEQAEPV